MGVAVIAANTSKKWSTKTQKTRINYAISGDTGRTLFYTAPTNGVTKINPVPTVNIVMAVGNNLVPYVYIKTVPTVSPGGSNRVYFWVNGTLVYTAASGATAADGYLFLYNLGGFHLAPGDMIEYRIDRNGAAGTPHLTTGVYDPTTNTYYNDIDLLFTDEVNSP